MPSLSWVVTSNKWRSSKQTNRLVNEVMMTTEALGVSLQYSHSMGRGEFAGPGFRNPVAMARGADDLIYVVNRSYEYLSLIHI